MKFEICDQEREKRKISYTNGLVSGLARNNRLALPETTPPSLGVGVANEHMGVAHLSVPSLGRAD